MNKTIFVRVEKVGIHCWKEANNFLVYPHRHKFFIEVEFQVQHNNREIEFFEAQRQVIDYLDIYWNEFKDNLGSCETIAESIFDYFTIKNWRISKVVVSEDNENGAVIRK